MKKLMIILLLVNTFQVFSNIADDTTYRVELHATMSPIVSHYEHRRFPGAPDDLTIGYGVFLRGMWHPGRMLSIGFMTGYLSISNEELAGNKNVSGHLSAIPMQFVISMQGSGIELGIGMGPYLVLSNIDNEEESQGKRLELGITAFASYAFPIGKNLYLCPELRALYFSYRGILSLMPSLNVRLDTLFY